MTKVNFDTRVAREYHESTKHSELSIRNSGRRLDWENKPRPFKIYTDLPEAPLPTTFPAPNLNALRAAGLLEPQEDGPPPKTVDARAISEILFFSAGITREMKSAMGNYYMRAASATGALYPIESYLVCDRIEGIGGAGIYHFNPGDFSLAKLREADRRTELSQTVAEERSEEILSAPVTIVFTSLAWRNAWKYEARSYRHWFWDSGVIAANLLATCSSIGLGSELLLGFADEQLSRLLFLEQGKEAPVALAPITLGSVRSSQKGNWSPPSSVESQNGPENAPTSRPEYLPLSEHEVDYPFIWRMNEASSLSNRRDVDNWLSGSTSGFSARKFGALRTYDVEPDSPRPDEPPALGETILIRGSTRRFATKPITFKQLSNVLYYSSRGVPADFLKGGELRSLVSIYLIANAIEEIVPGAYFYNREEGKFDLLKEGRFRSISSYLCLGQPLFGQASAVLFLMAPLYLILEVLGNRGYRAAQFEAGVVAGKVYLCSYAQSMGASGSTFYDDAVTEFFSPHASDKSTMIAVGIGVPAYSARAGKILAGKIGRDDILKAA